METQNTFTMEISVNLDDVLQHIYAQSAWHCAHNKQLYRLTSDNSTMLSLKVKEAFDNIYTQNMAYVSFANFNPNISAANIRFSFTFSHPYHEALPHDVEQIIEHALAAFALMRCYGDLDDYHATAWRKYSAQLRMVFARDANYDILHRA
jgi:hypothetical protein